MRKWDALHRISERTQPLTAVARQHLMMGKASCHALCIGRCRDAGFYISLALSCSLLYLASVYVYVCLRHAPFLYFLPFFLSSFLSLFFPFFVLSQVLGSGTCTWWPAVWPPPHLLLTGTSYRGSFCRRLDDSSGSSMQSNESDRDSVTSELSAGISLTHTLSLSRTDTHAHTHAPCSPRTHAPCSPHILFLVSLFRLPCCPPPASGLHAVGWGTAVDLTRRMRRPSSNT